jgi:hypothetical protein
MKLRSFTEWLEVKEGWETNLPVNHAHYGFVQDIKDSIDNYFNQIKDSHVVDEIIRDLSSYLRNYEPKRKQNFSGDLNTSMSPYNY